MYASYGALYIDGMVVDPTEVYIKENTSHQVGWGGDISRCHLGEKYENGREKGGKCKRKRKKAERKREKGE
jgi:hypothetical protein